MFSVAQNSDYVSSWCHPIFLPAVEAGDETPAPLKSRVPLGFLKVNGREEPVFAPIPGFEHMFTQKDVAAPSPQDTGKSRETGELTTHAPCLRHN